jgi:hypothetical protein
MRQDDLVAEIRPPLLKIMEIAAGPLAPVDLDMHFGMPEADSGGSRMQPIRVVKTSFGPLAAVVDIEEYLRRINGIAEGRLEIDKEGNLKCRRCGSFARRAKVNHSYAKSEDQQTVPVWEAGDKIIHTLHPYCFSCDEVPDQQGPPILFLGARDNRPS